MKKLFTLIATAFLCLTASAQVTSLYIAGAKGTVINGQTLADWDIVNTIEVQLNRGKFTLDCKDLTTIAISDKKLSTASWGDWMTGLWSAEIKEANIGQPVDLVGPGNMNFTAPWKGDWKLVISSDLKTITATTTTTKPETTYHLVVMASLDGTAPTNTNLQRKPTTCTGLISLLHSAILLTSTSSRTSSGMHGGHQA